MDRLQTRLHLGAAIDWIRLASSKGGDKGISKGYHILRNYWYPSYPETTGYTIPSLLNAADVLGNSELQTLAVSLADALLRTVTPEGGVVHWSGSTTDPIAFDTGQVMFGWLAAFGASDDQRFLQAAVAAGDWLVSAQAPSGSWKDHQHLGVEKVIDTRIAWALLELYKFTQKPAYRRAAERNLEWAQQKQDPDGWFRQCTFVAGRNPVTHTLAYTAEGFLECGCLLNETRFVESAKLLADALLARQHPDGRLVSAYGPGWRESGTSSCLTGNCQMALLWLRLYSITGRRDYLVAAKKAIAFVASTQNLGTRNRNVRGGIAGSWPVYGRYERFKVPNWAAKFFVDALLALEADEKGAHPPLFVG